ncbi:sugar ABC transporter permease [Thermoproteus tenax]|uniref:Maltose transport system permease protein n=1 Tax=Thermoproteus tenax (strain ATCC 35583 / DSM 2078 / JCM 9277 / NBRC 100435 / Kra 1) TaxID=768679 RepID=G4RLF3_THETK|nr:sugar ABC transporter permease [Thermoproteus tenax]CCC82398.1 maltose transport system permease protein [Thermoproteus tenax Kra 1]
MKVADVLRLTISYIILIVSAAIAVFPIYYIIITSLSDIPTLASVSVTSLVPQPKSLTLKAYYDILFQNPFFLWLRNSLILAAGTVALTVVLAFISGVALSRLNVPGKRALMITLYLLSFFPGVVMILPLYLMFSSLHMINTYYGLILAYSGGTSIYGAYLVKLFVDSIPREYEEAALIDGLSRPAAFIRILLPLSKPVVAFIALLAFMGAYTDYALANVFITSGNMWTLTLGMWYLSFTNRSTLYNVFAAFSVLMGTPIMAVFLAFQRYLTKMYTLSGVKA